MIKTQNEQMKSVIALLDNVAQARSTILLCGETGVGKEEMAKYIHRVSPRRKKPFIAVNCAAFPSELLESELFGSQKGAFTGAHQDRMGQIEAANDGTFLLDEISEMPFELQGKLLRVIQEKEIVRLGSNEPRKVDVRFICTTNKDLKEMVKSNLFRSDLFYRINVVPVKIPSLKERYEDMESITQYLAEKFSLENGVACKQIDATALAKIKKWSWPGNIRELQNVIERSVLACGNSLLEAKDILIDGFQEVRHLRLEPGMTIQEAEKMLIFKTLEHTKRNRTQAAKLLGISIRTLRNKLNEYKLEGDNESDFR